jgi:hypothetical protein
MPATEKQHNPTVDRPTAGSTGNGASTTLAASTGEGLIGRAVVSTTALTVDSLALARTAVLEAIGVADTVANAALEEFERFARELQPLAPFSDAPLKVTRATWERGSAGVRHLVALV